MTIIETLKRFDRKIGVFYNLYIRRRIPKEDRARKIFQNEFVQEAYEGIYEGIMLTKPLAKILYFYPIIFITMLFCHFIYKLFT